MRRKKKPKGARTALARRLMAAMMTVCMMLALAVPAGAAEETGGEEPVQTTQTGTAGGLTQTGDGPAEATEPTEPTEPEGQEDGGTDGTTDSAGSGSEAVARIGDTEYKTLKAAIEAASAEKATTIELLQDATLPDCTFPAGKTIVIDGTNTPGGNYTIDAEGAYLNFKGNVTFQNCELNLYGTPNGHWMYIYMASNGALTFENANVLIDGTDSTKPGTTAMYFPEPNTPKASVTIEHSTVMIKNCAGNGISWGGATSNGYNELTLQSSSLTIDNCAHQNASGGGGIIGTFNVTVTDSDLTVKNNKSYGSNGSNFYISDGSNVLFENNGTHGISSTDLTIEDSTVTAQDNGYYGIYVKDDFLIDSASVVNVLRNSSAYDCAGLKITSGVTDGEVRSGAVVNIQDNYCSGLSNNGKVVFEEGVKLTITGNVNDKGTTSNGGGIYNSGASADLTLPSDAVIYNNHTKTAGDDIFNNTNATITFGPVGNDWVLDGQADGKDCNGANHRIDGWYDDSAGSRWEAHKASGNHAVEYTPAEPKATITGLYAYKAAHGLGTLEVTKFVASQDEVDTNATFNVTVAIQSGDTKATVTKEISHGNTVEIPIPLDATYTVTETAAEGYQATVIGGEGKITETDSKAQVTVINVPEVEDTNALVISKTVEGNGDRTEFEFEVDLPVESCQVILTTTDGQGRTTTLEKGKVLVLRSGQSAVLCDLPVGGDYTVTEVPVANYQTTVEATNSTIDGATVTGTIPAAGTAPVIHYTNTYTPVDPIAITPADITIYMGGDAGYTAVVGEDETIVEDTNSLPTPLFKVTLPEGLEETDVTDIHLSGADGREWEFAPAGHTAEEGGEPLYYINATGFDDQDPVRIAFKLDGEIVTDDTFDHLEQEEVFVDHEIDIYRGNAGEVTATVDGQTYSVAVGTGTLRVRAVDNTADGNNPVETVTSQAPEQRLDPGTAAIVAPEGTTYTLNNTTVKVADPSGVGLLFDSIIDDAAHDRTNALERRIDAIDPVAPNTERHYQAQYLDLVDANNGNAWVKASGEVTVYWAYPEDTGLWTNFTLYHFKDLHRDGETSGFDVADMNSVTVETVTLTKDAAGISFQVGSGGFSPFVLVW